VWPSLSHKFPLHLLQGRLNWILQTGYSTALLYSKNELSSHASAAAYYFLLAIAPMILVVVSILNTSLINYPELTADLFAFLSQFNEQLNEDFFRRIGILQAQTAVSGLGLLGFLWTSRLIISSVQSAFGVIFPSTRSRSFFWSNALSMVLVPGVLTLLLLSAVFNIVIRFLHQRVEQIAWMERLYDVLLSLSGLVLPVALVFGLIFVCYRFLPLARPGTWHAVLGAGLCTLAIFGLKTAFVHFVSLATYHIVYGSLGAVIFLLLWVYLVFLVFFLFAQFVHVAGRIDIIALDKIIAPQGEGEGLGSRLERSLFGRSRRIFFKYAKRVKDGELVFAQGDQDKEIYYLHQGRVEILRRQSEQEEPASVAQIEQGQIFGEMAYLLGEGRTATARAKGEVELLLIPPKVFEGLLEQSPAVARKIIASMSRRLKQATRSGSM
jgi:membrane protein